MVKRTAPMLFGIVFTVFFVAGCDDGFQDASDNDAQAVSGSAPNVEDESASETLILSVNSCAPFLEAAAKVMGSAPASVEAVPEARDQGFGSCYMASTYDEFDPSDVWHVNVLVSEAAGTESFEQYAATYGGLYDVPPEEIDAAGFTYALRAPSSADSSRTFEVQYRFVSGDRSLGCDVLKAAGIAEDDVTRAELACADVLRILT